MGGILLSTGFKNGGFTPLLRLYSLNGVPVKSDQDYLRDVQKGSVTQIGHNLM